MKSQIYLLTLFFCFSSTASAEEEGKTSTSKNNAAMSSYHFRIKATNHHRASGTSDHTGEERLVRPHKNGFLTALAWSEKSDEPCAMRLWSFHYNSKKYATSRGWAYSFHELNKSDDSVLCSYKESNQKTVALLDPREYDRFGETNTPMRVIQSLRICTNSNKKKSYKTRTD